MKGSSVTASSSAAVSALISSQPSSSVGTGGGGAATPGSTLSQSNVGGAGQVNVNASSSSNIATHPHTSNLDQHPDQPYNAQSSVESNNSNKVLYCCKKY